MGCLPAPGTKDLTRLRRGQADPKLPAVPLALTHQVTSLTLPAHGILQTLQPNESKGRNSQRRLPGTWREEPRLGGAGWSPEGRGGEGSAAQGRRPPPAAGSVPVSLGAESSLLLQEAPGQRGVGPAAMASDTAHEGGPWPGASSSLYSEVAGAALQFRPQVAEEPKAFSKVAFHRPGSPVVQDSLRHWLGYPELRFRSQVSLSQPHLGMERTKRDVSEARGELGSRGVCQRLVSPPTPLGRPASSQAGAPGGPGGSGLVG